MTLLEQAYNKVKTEKDKLDFLEKTNYNGNFVDVRFYLDRNPSPETLAAWAEERKLMPYGYGYEQQLEYAKANNKTALLQWLGQNIDTHRAALNNEIFAQREVYKKAINELDAARAAAPAEAEAFDANLTSTINLQTSQNKAEAAKLDIAAYKDVITKYSIIAGVVLIIVAGFFAYKAYKKGSLKLA